MKRILGLMVVCVVLVSTIAIGQMAGFVDNEIFVDFGEPWSDALWLDFEVGFEYTVGSWTFGALADLYEEGLYDLAFVTVGSIGAIDVYSMYWLDGEDFDYEDNMYADWDNAAWTTIAGADFWVLFSQVEHRDFGWDGSGAGLAIGTHGTAGDVEVWSEIQFNLYPLLPFIYENGIEKTVEMNLPCDLIDVIDPTCRLDFTGAQFLFDFPFCSADAGSLIGFGTGGFYGVEFWMLDLATGIPGVILERTSLVFTPEEKTLYFWLGFDPGPSLCITPFVTLDLDDPTTVVGCEIDALQLACTIGDVSVVISELFANDDYYIGIDGVIHEYWGLLSYGTLTEDCVDEAFGVQEAIGIEIGRDDCCSNESFVGIYSYFDLDLADSLFDWLGLRARVELAFSPLLSAFVEAWIWHDEFDSIAFGFDYSWGTLRALTKDWTCCWGIF